MGVRERERDAISSQRFSAPLFLAFIALLLVSFLLLSLLALTCLYVLFVREPNIVVLFVFFLLVPTLSYFVDTSLAHFFFLSSFSTITIQRLTLSFGYSSDNTLKKNRTKKKRTDKLKQTEKKSDT
jgi:uncharacterized RDD family membrane protein YckC